MQLPKYSMGVGDRFAHQAPAQLEAMQRAAARGIQIAPVWNKSHREHTIVGSSPRDVRVAADAACKARGWKAPYFVDADHIGLKNVDGFLDSSDFFTLDVADSIGVPPAADALARFVAKNQKFVGRLSLPGVEAPLEITAETIRQAGEKFLAAVQHAGEIYRRIEKAKGAGTFVTEVSFDESDTPQTPAEMLLILAALAEERVPLQTIAPRFSGRFNKGVDYVGDVAQFGREFENDVAVIALARQEFGLPANLKLSVHSGSDKFSIYGPIQNVLRKFDAGVHVKTAGTTWLEELIGLAMADGDGLEIAKTVYTQALGRFEELCAPYATVVDIDRRKLPSPETVQGWDGATFASALRHDPNCAAYNPNVRQLLHVGYKVAAEMGRRYREALEKHAALIAQNVVENLYDRHICRLFPGQ